MSGAFGTIRLIALRDLRERLRTRAYRISTVVTVLLVGGLVAVPALLDDDERPTYSVVVAGTVPPVLEDALSAVAERDDAVLRLDVVGDRSAAVDLLESGDADVALAGDEVLVESSGIDEPAWARDVAAVAGQVSSLRQAGLDEAEVRAVLAAPVPEVRGLEPEDADEGTRQATAFVGSLLLYSFLSLYGAWVLYGVAEEKSSRVAEVLLSTVRPSSLLAGKVIGIGAAALLQGVLVLAAALLAAVATGSGVLDALPASAIPSLLGWFLLGYALYSVVYAAAGSLVARQEDVQNVATPPALPLLVGYIVATGAAFGGADTAVVRVFSLFPATSPVVMPVRTTVSDVPAWEVALSVVLILAAIVVLVQVAGRVYARALLRTGGRVKWREVLRPAAA